MVFLDTVLLGEVVLDHRLELKGKREVDQLFFTEKGYDDIPLFDW